MDQIPWGSFLCHFEGHGTSLIFSLGLVFPPFKHAETVVLSRNVRGAGKCLDPGSPLHHQYPGPRLAPPAPTAPGAAAGGNPETLHAFARGAGLSSHIWFQFSKCFCTFCCREEIKSSKCKLRAERAWENSKESLLEGSPGAPGCGVYLGLMVEPGSPRTTQPRARMGWPF